MEHRIQTYEIANATLEAVCTNLDSPGVPNVGPPSSNYVCDGHKVITPFLDGSMMATCNLDAVLGSISALNTRHFL